MVVTRAAVQKTLLLLVVKEAQQSWHCLVHFKKDNVVSFRSRRRSACVFVAHPGQTAASANPFSLMIWCCWWKRGRQLNFDSRYPWSCVICVVHMLYKCRSHFTRFMAGYCSNVLNSSAEVIQE